MKRLSLLRPAARLMSPLRVAASRQARPSPMLQQRLSSTAAGSSSTASSSGESTNTRRLGALLFSSMTGTTCMLCYWQAQRYQWKVKLIEERQATLAAAPRPLHELVPATSGGLPEEQQFQRVYLEGEFDHAGQALVGPRSAPAGAGVGGGAPAGAANQSGWDVLTPLTRPDGSRVLINRGWVPREAVGSIEQPKGVQQLSGVLKAGEKPNKYATNDVANGRYIWLDIDTLAAETRSDPLLVVAVGDGVAAADKRQQRWPHPRPVEAFMNFHVTPSTHLVRARPCGPLHAEHAPWLP